MFYYWIYGDYLPDYWVFRTISPEMTIFDNFRPKFHQFCSLENHYGYTNQWKSVIPSSNQTYLPINTYFGVHQRFSERLLGDIRTVSPKMTIFADFRPEFHQFCSMVNHMVMQYSGNLLFYHGIKLTYP